MLAEGVARFPQWRLAADRLTVGQLAAWLAARGGARPSLVIVHPAVAAVELFEQSQQMVGHLVEDVAAGPAHRAALLAAATGLDPRHLLQLARQAHDWWPLLEGAAREAGRGGPKSSALEAMKSEELPLDIAPLLAELDAAVELRRWCVDQDDRLLCHLDGPVASAASRLRAAAGNAVETLSLLESLSSFVSTAGRRQAWDGRSSEVRAQCRAAQRCREDLLHDLSRRCTGLFCDVLSAEAARRGRERAAERRMAPVDALHQARQELRNPEVLAHVARRWHLVAAPIRQANTTLSTAPASEAGDGNPVTLLLLEVLSALEEAGTEVVAVADPEESPGTALRRWGDSEVWLPEDRHSAAGLVAVRRLLRQRLAPAGAATDIPLVVPRPSIHSLQLSFDLLGSEEPPPGDEPGELVREAPAVAVVGDALAAPPRAVDEQMAADVARAVRSFVRRGWPLTRDEQPPRGADVAVVAPDLASVLDVGAALEAAGVPVRLEGRALWHSIQVRDLMAVLSAADDPSDPLKVVAALRTPGLGCGDDDLVRWHHSGGRWDPTEPGPPGTGEQPVAAGLAVLDHLYHLRWWEQPSEVVEAAIATTHARVLAGAGPHPGEAVRRLQVVVETARVVADAAESLAPLLQWAELYSSGTGPEVMPVGTPTGCDAVWLSMLDEAVGRRFSTVVLVGLHRRVQPRAEQARIASIGGKVVIHAGGRFKQLGWDQLDVIGIPALQPVLQAAGLARDHLVVALHRPLSPAGTSSPAAELAELLADHPALWQVLS